MKPTLCADVDSTIWGTGAWVRTHFGPAVGLTVTTGDKLDILEELGAFGLIDTRL